MPIPGGLLTTAMGVMPHKDIDRALSVALSLDIPFWPQLPLYSYYEDMYVQASEHFPGILLDIENRKLGFSINKFELEMEKLIEHFDEPEYFDITPEYSAVYHRFLEMDHSTRPAIRGQIEGPISFGFNVADEDGRPILFNDMVRSFLLEFMAKRVNIQLKRLKEKNPNAFMFIDEPGLQFVFSGMSGYNNVLAHDDMELFLSLIESPKGIHLCGKPDWDFLLTLDMDILSLDVYSNGEVFVNYWSSIRRFLDRGGILVWGIVPTNFEPFNNENLESLQKRLEEMWRFLGKKGVDIEYLLSRSLLSPATCCLVNPDGEKTVESAFEVIKKLSQKLKEKMVPTGLEPVSSA